MLIFSPIFLLVSTLIIIFMGYPVFFIQKRPGYRSIIFNLFKFRTMKLSINLNEKVTDIKRTTKLGNWLRKYSIDELPSFYNVLKGDMSLVGPRPLLVDYLKLYNQDQIKRHNVKPGITGWAQINGRNSISWEKKFDLDIWYVKNKSLYLDFKILIMTIKKVIIKEGINQSNTVNMEKFKGNL